MWHFMYTPTVAGTIGRAQCKQASMVLMPPRKVFFRHPGYTLLRREAHLQMYNDLALPLVKIMLNWGQRPVIDPW